MSNGAYSISVLAKIDDAKSRASIEAGLNKIGKQVKGIDIKQLTALNTSYAKLKDGTEQLRIKTATFKNELNGLTKVTLNADGSVKKYDTSMKNLGKANTNVSSSTKAVSDGMNNVSKNTNTASKSVSSFTEQMSKNLGKFISWSLITTAYFASLRALKEMVDEVKALDDAMLELSKVTELSGKQLQDFARNAQVVGDALNASAAKVVLAASDFSRMGFSPEVSTQLASDAIVLTKIADGITEVSEASTAMISILKGFNMEASESSHVIDSINEVSNKFAISTSDLADGLRRAGGVLSQSNTTFEQTIGLLTAGQESLQSIEKVSSGLITISTRLRGISESGEEIDGLMPKLQKAFKEFAGIDIQTTNGEMRSTYDILTDLSKVWGTLNDEQQSYIGFLASGLRQSPVLNAVLTNMANGASATASAMDSAGSATVEFEKYSESLQGKLDKLGTTWSNISNDFISSDFLSSVLDFAEGISTVVESIGMLNTVLLVTTGILSAKGVIGFTGLSMALGKYAAAAGLSATATTALASAFSILSPVAALGAIMLLIKGLDLLIVTQEELEQKYQDSKAELQGIQTELESYESRIDSLSKAELAYLEILRDKEELLRSDTLKLQTELNNKEIESIERKIDAEKRYKETVEGDNKYSSIEYATSPAIIDKRTTSLSKYNEVLAEYNEGNMESKKSLVELKETLLEEYNAIELQKEIYGELSNELWNYRTQLVGILGINDGYVDNFIRTDTVVKQNILSVTGLSNALMELNETGKISDSTFLLLAQNQSTVQFALNATKEELEHLASVYGYSAQEISDIQAQLTNVLIQQARKRMLAIATEYLALQAHANTIMSGGGTLSQQEQYALYGSGRVLGEAMMNMDKYIDRLDELDSYSEKSTKSTSGTTKAVKELTVAYKDFSEQLTQENIEAVKEYQKAIEEAIDEEMEKIEASKTAWERSFDDRKEASDRFFEDQANSLDSEIDSIKEKRELESDIADIKEKQNALDEARQRLEDAERNKNTRIFTGNGWEWTADPEEIRSAQEAIDSANKALDESKLKQQQTLEDQLLEDKKESLEERKLLVDRAFEDEKVETSRFYEDLNTTIKGLLDEISDTEALNYRDRLEALRGYASAYNSIMGTISMSNVAKSVGGIESSITSKAPILLSDSDIDKINRYRAYYDKAKAMGDTAGMAKAHADAEAIRSKYGYSGGASGDLVIRNGGLMDSGSSSSITKSIPSSLPPLNNKQSPDLSSFIKSMPSMQSTNKTTISSSKSAGITIQNLNLPAVKDSNGFIRELKNIATIGER